jgi:hypothetical protein
MEVPVFPAQIEGMKPSILIAGILAAGIAAQDRDSKPPDVMIYVNGDAASSSVDQRVRATVTWMFARVGVRLAWRYDNPRAGTASGTPVTVLVRFIREAPDASPEALAQALPFGAAGVVHVMYERIRWVAGRPSREPGILAHVLAHEIGHVLQCTDTHAPAGVMKALWNGQDFDAMERKPLEFTVLDVEMIKNGLNLRKAGSAPSSPQALPAAFTTLK